MEREPTHRDSAEPREGFRPSEETPVETRSKRRSKGSSGRLVGVDVARALAVLGMVMAHFGPNPASGTLPESFAADLYGVVDGRASVLFVLLAGVGVTLLSRARSASPERVRGRLVLRGALLLPLGLWLQGLDHGVLVILQYYALYFLFAALVLSLSSRWLLVCAIFALAVGPLFYVGVRSVAPEWFIEAPATFGTPVGDVAGDLLLSGAYPLVTWSIPLLFGMWIGDRDLRSTATRLRMICFGLAVAVAAPLVSGALVGRFGEPLVGSPRLPKNAGFSNLLSAEAHSQMPLWMLGAVGVACAVLGATLLISDLFPRAIWPLAATGQLALSVYVGHLVLLHFYEELLRRETLAGAALSVGAFMLLAIFVCALWRAAFPRGPLEYALAAPWRLVEKLLEKPTKNPDKT